MQFANILFNDFYLFFVYFSFLLLACLSVILSVFCLSAKSLSSHFALLYRVRSQWRGGRGATLCQKEDTHQFSQPEYCRLRKKALPSPQCDSLSRGKLVLVHRNPILPYLVLRSSRRLLTTVSVDSQLETIVSLTFWLSQGML